MKPSEFVKAYTLFDSLVEDLEYDEVKKQLRMTLGIVSVEAVLLC